MATVEYRVCDRCGKKIEECKRGTVKGKFKIHRIFGFGAYNYSDVEYELCDECMEILYNWLFGSKVEKMKKSLEAVK